MKKTMLISVITCCLSVSACSINKRLDGTTYEQHHTNKPVFCYQLAPQDQSPNQNCIGSGGHQ